jgi:hypothetical protein
VFKDLGLQIALRGKRIYPEEKNIRGYATGLTLFADKERNILSR